MSDFILPNFPIEHTNNLRTLNYDTVHCLPLSSVTSYKNACSFLLQLNHEVILKQFSI